jgi:hypothetical protein
MPAQQCAWRTQVVIIKLEQHDPEQLRANAISAINNMLSQTSVHIVFAKECFICVTTRAWFS